MQSLLIQLMCLATIIGSALSATTTTLATTIASAPDPLEQSSEIAGGALPVSGATEDQLLAHTPVSVAAQAPTVKPSESYLSTSCLMQETHKNP